MIEHLRGVGLLRRTDRDADADAATDALTVHLERRLHGFDNLRGDKLGVFRYVEVGQDYRELIAAEARDGIGLSSHLFETIRDLHQKSVSRRVPKVIVDGFEVIQVQEHERNRFSIPAGLGERFSMFGLKEGAIGETGQNVELRKCRQFFLCTSLFRDVDQDVDVSIRLARRETET